MHANKLRLAIVLLQTKNKKMPLSLIYTPNKGLTKVQSNVLYSNIIIEHDERGIATPLHEQVLEIQERNVKITVRTNLHYGKKSYMNARINILDKPVLNFIDNTLLYPVDLIHANPGDWNMLFDRTIQLYSTIFTIDNYIISYFDVIDDAVANKYSPDLNNAFDRLFELSEKVLNSVYADSSVLDLRMKQSCRLLISKIMKMKFDMTISRKPYDYFEKNIRSVFAYLAKREEIIEVLAN